MSVIPPGSVADLAIGGVVFVAAACVPQSDLPFHCDANQVTRPATLTDAGLNPDAIDVCTGQQVTIPAAVLAR